MRRLFVCTLFAFALLTVAATAREMSYRAGSQPENKKQTPEPASRARIIDEIRGDLDSAVEKLNQGDASQPTRAIQERILENLKKLLNPDDDPPPPSSNSRTGNPPPRPMSPPPSSASNNPEQTSANKAQPVQKAASQSKASDSNQRPAPPPMATAPGKKSAPLADTHWGESPWRLNQRIDAASQGRFPPRYEELLREYYRALAESDRRE